MNRLLQETIQRLQREIRELVVLDPKEAQAKQAVLESYLLELADA